MDPRERPEKRRYVVLVFVDVNPDYYELGEKKRADLTAPHIKELTEHLKYVSLVSLRGTGLAEDTMIEVLESDSLIEIEKMMDTYKAGRKAAYGRIKNVIVTEKCMVREMTG
ncbi:hypothetical protein L0666_11810 [Octadecabacter sp. CECT 8868]|uniref:hypothetical protein n=1 Tax=Octadecabacter algicola TaxID=2909342 RepID=UPI001F232536|nr:hypothetical protein [Octadecabacter algicola]MCF2905674.1 hypothetical protein [Octadecabacter algicola]